MRSSPFAFSLLPRCHALREAKEYICTSAAIVKFWWLAIPGGGIGERAIEAIVARSRNNADNARLANELAAVACGVAGKGGEVVSDVVETMTVSADSASCIARKSYSAYASIVVNSNTVRASGRAPGFALVVGESMIWINALLLAQARTEVAVINST